MNNNLDMYLQSRKGKIIHQIWFGTIPNQESAKKAYDKLSIYRNSWKKHNSNWTIIEWNKDMCDTLIDVYYSHYKKVYDTYKYQIQQCDMVRYAILHRYGGLYADMDYYCNQPWDNVVDKYPKDLYLVQSCNMDGLYVSNSLMYSKPKHIFWKLLLNRMKYVDTKNIILRFNRHAHIMYTTGPGIITDVFNMNRKRYGLAKYPYKLFHPFGIETDVISLRKNPNVYAIHAGKGSWESSDSKILIHLYKNAYIFIAFSVVIICIIFLIFKQG